MHGTATADYRDNHLWGLVRISQRDKQKSRCLCKADGIAGGLKTKKVLLVAGYDDGSQSELRYLVAFPVKVTSGMRTHARKQSKLKHGLPRFSGISGKERGYLLFEGFDSGFIGSCYRSMRNAASIDNDFYRVLHIDVELLGCLELSIR
jgi:hypothetical protein